MRVLVTRPLPDGERTASELRARGHDVLLAPLLRIEPLLPSLERVAYTALLMTSANAARAIAAHARFAEIRGRPLYVVGRQTGATALAVGFTDVRAAGGDARDLASMVAAEPGLRAGVLLHLAGADRAADLAGALAAAGVAVDTAIVYRAHARDDLPAAAVAALAGNRVDAVLHFSQRSSAAFLGAARQSGQFNNALNAIHYCLSAQVATPLRQAQAPRVAIAARAHHAAMLDLVGRA